MINVSNKHSGIESQEIDNRNIQMEFINYEILVDKNWKEIDAYHRSMDL